MDGTLIGLHFRQQGGWYIYVVHLCETLSKRTVSRLGNPLQRDAFWYGLGQECPRYTDFRQLENSRPFQRWVAFKGM